MSNQIRAPRQRPVGVTIIALLQGLVGILYIIFGMFTIVAKAMGAQSDGLGAAGTIVGVILLILGILFLLFGWGLWTLKHWAFWVTVVLLALSFIFGLINIMSGDHTATTIIRTVLALVIVLYLLADRNVRAAFE